MFDKTSTFFIITICGFYITSVVLHFYFPVHCTDYRFSISRPSVILDFPISQYLLKIQICAYFYVDMQNLVKIGGSTTKLLRLFDFENGGRPPFWICYDVIADYPRFMSDGSTIARLVLQQRPKKALVFE